MLTIQCKTDLQTDTQTTLLRPSWILSWTTWVSRHQKGKPHRQREEQRKKQNDREEKRQTGIWRKVKVKSAIPARRYVKCHFELWPIKNSFCAFL